MVCQTLSGPMPQRQARDGWFIGSWMVGILYKVDNLLARALNALTHFQAPG